ncbi:hypothetical protein KSP40_PGU000980 [Platanthera guangdongensis]|uniref:Uncharacterized protein n=1 Tax=Platanthera guangdongensis TaxID=2320717 RepID=A0ABR2MR57_9ASPA
MSSKQRRDNARISSARGTCCTKSPNTKMVKIVSPLRESIVMIKNIPVMVVRPILFPPKRFDRRRILFFVVNSIFLLLLVLK